MLKKRNPNMLYYLCVRRIKKLKTNIIINQPITF